MKRIFWLNMAFVVFWMCSTVGLGQVVVPNANESVDGSTENRFPLLTDGGMRYQQVYEASEFSSFSSNGELINGIWFRPDRNFSGFGPITIEELQISLSTTNRGADELSGTFANNIGSDNLVVLSNDVTISSDSTPGPGNTFEFDVFIEFETPFLYNPSNGNLLLDVLNRDPADNDIDTFFDAVVSSNDSVSRVFSGEGGFASTSGTTGTLGLVTRFSVVPEPSAAILMGFATLFCGRRSKRS